MSCIKFKNNDKSLLLRFVDFKKIQNIIPFLNSSFTLQLEGEWINEAVSVFKCDKASLQIEIIEFQADYI